MLSDWYMLTTEGTSLTTFWASWRVPVMMYVHNHPQINFHSTAIPENRNKSLHTFFFFFADCSTRWRSGSRVSCFGHCSPRRLWAAQIKPLSRWRSNRHVQHFHLILTPLKKSESLSVVFMKASIITIGQILGNHPELSGLNGQHSVCNCTLSSLSR